MPAIVIKDYKWRQTSEWVILQVPLKGHPRKVDLLLIDNYLKTSFPPFILELFLWGNVIEEDSKCTIANDEALLSLRKETNSDWPQLELKDIDKETKRKYRERALERLREVTEDREKANSERRQLLQKEAVKAQINSDTATLNKIEAMRDTHRREVMNDLEQWRTANEMPILSGVEGKLQENRAGYKPPLKWFKDDDGSVKSRPLTNKEIIKDEPTIKLTEVEETQDLEQNKNRQSSSGKTVDTKEQKEQENSPTDKKTTETDGTNCEVLTERQNLDKTRSVNRESSNESGSSTESDSEESSDGQTGKERKLRKFYKKKRKQRPGQETVERILKGEPIRRAGIFDDPGRAVPLPRRNGVINVKFTERVFPTPARESSRLEEEQWLQKQAEARRKTGFIAEDLRPEERDPQWLKDKGDEFFKVGNYLGAVSAYTHGIKISDKMASLYVNRSAAQYALGNYFRCVEDCTKALELMEPKCEGNRESRARCHARRGAALCKLSAPQHGIPELEAALKLLPENESIKTDLFAARQYFCIKDGQS